MSNNAATTTVDPVDYALVGVNLTGSLLSLFGTCFILLCYLILPHNRHVRHALIVNLTLADFINAANNSISGLWVLINDTNLGVSDGCTANGFIGQLSVQAVDFSIFTLTACTVWIILTRRISSDLPLSRIILLCVASWIVPIITSNIALFGGYYGPASSNWCWIQEHPVYLRYVLTHGWRFVIILSVTGMCIYIQMFLRSHIHPMNSSFSNHELNVGGVPVLNELADRESGLDEHSNYGEHDDGIMCVTDYKNLDTDSVALAPGTPGSQVQELPSGNTPASTNFATRMKNKFTNLKTSDPENQVTNGSIPSSRRQTKVAIERTMLLHAYPIFYIILWIPGIAMRIAQATGHNLYALQIMQASTQYIGFANALTFGWNERIGVQLRAWWHGGRKMDGGIIRGARGARGGGGGGWQNTGR